MQEPRGARVEPDAEVAPSAEPGPERAGRKGRPRPTACLNCGSTLVDAFCARCGQRNVDMRIPARDLALDAVEDGLSLDSRVARTVVPFLFRPGFLTVEWTSGRRARFSSPLRLYLLSSFVFFLATSIVEDGGTSVHLRGEPVEEALQAVQEGLQEGPSGVSAADGGKVAREGIDVGGLRIDVSSAPEGGDGAPRLTPGTEEQHARLRAQGWLGRRLDDRWREFETIPPREAVKRVNAAFREWAPRIVFFLVPAGVVILALLWRRRWLSEHVVLALHLHAFAFAVFTALVGARLLPWGGAREVLRVLAFSWLGTGFVLALRRVYGERWRWTLPKAAVAALLYLVALGIGLAGVAGLALWFA
jgi:Protein of unknown function (DUF3667)